MPARDYYLKGKGLCQREQTLCQREQRPTHAHRCAGLACGARSSPRGGWLREVRRWACCGLRRTGGPESRFWGVFIIAVHRAFVLGLGAQRHRGIAELSEDRYV